MDVPQINSKTGISSDYWNEYNAKTVWLKKGHNYVINSIKEYPIRKYEQVYPPETYDNVITPENSQKINRLNELADLVNNTFIDATKFTETDFKKVINEVSNIIYGIEIYKKI